MLRVAWLVINSDSKISDDEALLMRLLARLARDRHQVVDDELARLVDVDAATVWHRIEHESGDLSDIVDAGTKVAEIDGKVNASERRVLAELTERSRGATSHGRGVSGGWVPGFGPVATGRSVPAYCDHDPG